jgi:hypothetical protein
MSEQKQVYKGDLADFDTVDLEAPLKNVESKVCDHYCWAYWGDAEKERERGNEQKAAVYRFIGTVASFYLSEGDPTKPYMPVLQMPGRRGLIPDDLAPTDLKAVRAIAEQAKDHAIRARFYDVLWLKERDHNACREASASYLESAKELDTDDNWVHAVKQYRRGLRLASKLGRQNPPFQNLCTSLCLAIAANPDQEVGFRTYQLLQIASEEGCGDSVEWARICFEIGERAGASGEHRRARKYWMLEGSFRRATKDQSGAAAASLRVAEAYVSEGMARAEGHNASYFAAATLLKEGVEALRRAQAKRERVDTVKVKLAEFQELSLEEMKSFEYSQDISQIVKGAQDHVQGLDLIVALLRLAFGAQFVDVANLKETVMKGVNEFPMQHLFSGSVVDEKGRSTVEIAGLLGLQGEEAEIAIENEMFSHLSRFQWGIRVQGFIEPARVQILNEHHPDLRDLAFLVRNNPFVPPGHEGVFLRGLHAGFHGDFLVAAHLLVPQIENSIRYVLESTGVDVSNLMSDGTQPVKILGPLFDLKETTQIFGNSLVFELRGLLIEKRGSDFRNRIAHGFVSEAECYSAAPIILWWIVLRLCLLPKLQATDPGPAPEVGQRNDFAPNDPTHDGK